MVSCTGLFACHAFAGLRPWCFRSTARSLGTSCEARCNPNNRFLFTTGIGTLLADPLLAGIHLKKGRSFIVQSKQRFEWMLYGTEARVRTHPTRIISRCGAHRCQAPATSAVAASGTVAASVEASTASFTSSSCVQASATSSGGNPTWLWVKTNGIILLGGCTTHFGVF